MTVGRHILVHTINNLTVSYPGTVSATCIIGMNTVITLTGTRSEHAVDSHIQRIVLATEETTMTQQVSHRPIKCQSCSWSQRGTKVNVSHHGDNPLLRSSGIQIATKSYAALQAKWHRPLSKRFIKSPYSIISRATSIARLEFV